VGLCKQAYTVSNFGLRLGCVKGQSFVHMQVKQISLDFLGTFFIKEKGTKHIYSTNHLGKAPFIKEKGTKHIYSTNHPGNAQNIQ
jgi:hypothetical protein